MIKGRDLFAFKRITQSDARSPSRHESRRPLNCQGQGEGEGKRAKVVAEKRRHRGGTPDGLFLRASGSKTDLMKGMNISGRGPWGEIREKNPS